MGAHYDTYDYPAYWEGRDYEHESELLALTNFLNKIDDVGKLLEIGAGFGRLASHYSYRAKKVYLTDPSAKLLALAREKLKGNKNIKFIQISAEKLPQKFKAKTFDTLIMVRVMHHIEDPEKICQIACRLLKNKGYFILEFPNKVHIKEICKKFLRGDFTFPLDIFPTDKAKKQTLPFKNYHPDDFQQILKKCGFEIIEKRSVSNIRSPLAKKYLPLPFLTSIEEKLQVILAKLNFGPSIFILARKKGMPS